MKSLRKKNEIMNSDEIYRIESMFRSYSFFSKTLSTIIVLVVEVYFAYYALAKFPFDLSMFLIIGTIVLASSLLLLLYRIFSRGNPLVFTKNGIFLQPFFYEYWDDIESFSFKKYFGKNRITLSKKGEGIALSIQNKGLVQRTTNLRGNSYIVTNGIFIDASQVNRVEEIFLSHGIRRNLLSDEL